jgi:A nuclease of the HNH/ENDO VII superfamily with conserved WHH
MKNVKNIILVLATGFLFAGNPATGFFFARGAFAGTCTTKVNGRSPINSTYAGKTYSISATLQQKYNVTGVAFSAAGFPNFAPFAIKSVTPAGLTGDRANDNKLANKAAGYTVQPANTVWHHVEDCMTMQLLPLDIHGAVRHTGGAAIIQSGSNITVDATIENNEAGD